MAFSASPFLFSSPYAAQSKVESPVRVPTVSCSSTHDQSQGTKSRLTRRVVSEGCKLVGCGSAVPDLCISNDDISKIVETSDEWISARTGIRNRRVLSGNSSLTSLSVEAAKKALHMAEVQPNELDLVLMCTSSPDDLFGSAPQVQNALGCTKNPLAYDITAACSGFVLGLISAACHIRGGGFRNVLVIGADALSRHVDWSDRGTCILFGDAAAAVVLQACDCDDDGVLGIDVHSDGSGRRHLSASISGDGDFPPKRPSHSFIHMNGQEVFRFAVRCVPASISAALGCAGMHASTLDWLLLHQANRRIIDSVATRLEIPAERVISNLENYGNTSAASIPLAMDEAVRSGKVRPGDTIAVSGFGAGLTWASAIIRWQ